jgi:hypothetical protein
MVKNGRPVSRAHPTSQAPETGRWQKRIGRWDVVPGRRDVGGQLVMDVARLKLGARHLALPKPLLLPLKCVERLMPCTINLFAAQHLQHSSRGLWPY